MNIVKVINGQSREINIQFSKYLQSGFTSLDISTSDEKITTTINIKEARLTNSNFIMVQPDCQNILRRLGLIGHEPVQTFKDFHSGIVYPIYILDEYAQHIKNQQLALQNNHAFAKALA